MGTVVAKKIDRQWVIRGLWVGLVLLAAGWLLIEEIPLPRAVRSSLIQNNLIPLLVFPTVVLLVAAAVAAVRRRDAIRWIAMSLGAAAAPIALVLTVLAAMGVIALFVV